MKIKSLITIPIFAILIVSCSSTPDKTQNVGIVANDNLKIEEMHNDLDLLKTERRCFIKLMGHAQSLDELNKYKAEIDKLNKEIFQLETNVPQSPPKSPRIDEKLTDDQAEIIRLKKERIEESQKEVHVFIKLLENAKDKHEAIRIRKMIDSANGEIDTNKEVIRALELEYMAQNRFSVKKGYVYGPIGLTCKILEITLNRFFIIFEF